jgi:hypothetical protein
MKEVQKKIDEKTNLPEMKMSAGPIKATVWKNHSTRENGEESEYSTITLERVYKDKLGEWHSTNILRLSDLPKAAALLQKVFENKTITEITV